MNNYDRAFLNLLNLDSSLIKNIESSMDDNGINTVIVTPSPISKECIYCGNKKLKSKGFYTTSSINAIDATKDCIVHYKIKRHYCDQCNLSFTDEYHIKPRNGNLSYSTIQKIMTLLSNASITFRQVAKLLHVSPQSVLRTFDKYCHVVPMSFPEVLCIDEVYTKNSDFDSKFSCVFYDFFHRKILDITPSRHKAYLLSYLERFPEDERNKVLYVCMDMYSPYKDVIQLRFKKATICVDSFHVIKALNDCASQVRIRFLKKFESSSQEYYLLKQWKNLFLGSCDNLDNDGKYNSKFKRHMNYRDLLNAILSIHSDLFKTYELKERYIEFNRHTDYENPLTIINTFYTEFVQANIPEFSSFISILGNWNIEIANSFQLYKGRRLSNGIAESLNAQIKLVLINSKGIRNSERRKKRIMYVVNKDSFSL